MIDLERLTNDLATEVKLIAPEFLPRWERFKVSPYTVNCIRLADYGLEQVYVVARDGNEVILFDDVEEEFGIGLIGHDGILKAWGIYGGLDSCIKCFPVANFMKTKGITRRSTPIALDE